MNWIRRVVSSLSQVPDTPERTALAFSLGVLLGFSPFVGLHTVLGILLALLLRLNRAAVLLGVWTNVPWILVPYYTFATFIGIELLGMQDALVLPKIGIGELLSRTFWSWLIGQWRLLIPAFVGSSLLSILFAAVSYPLALRLVRRFRDFRSGK